MLPGVPRRRLRRRRRRRRNARSEKALKKKATEEKKAAAAAKKEERQAKKDAKPKMVDADGNEIKKNQSAYFLFQAAKREEVTSELQSSCEAVEEIAKVSLGTVAKKIGELWKACSDKDKTEFIVAAYDDKVRYEAAVAANPENAKAVSAAKEAKAANKQAKTKKTKSTASKVQATLEELGVELEDGEIDESEENGGDKELLERKVANQGMQQQLQSQLEAAHAEVHQTQVAFKAATEEVARLLGQMEKLNT